MKVITNNLDVWTSAQIRKPTVGRGGNGKLAAYGVKKLRKLILELAVRGKLVRQDPNDESATVSLKKIKDKKNKLIENGEIRKQEPLTEINQEDMPFNCPEGWVWVKLGELLEMFNGRAFKSTEWGIKGMPIIRIQNLNDPQADFNYFDGDIDEQHLVADGDLLISWSGTPGTSFGAFIWKRGAAALNQHINKCWIFHKNINLEYLKLAINSCMDHLISKAQGGVGLKHVTKGTLNNIIFGLPPLAEQQRIVVKVDELMSLCNQLEQQQASSIESHQILVEILLGTLTSAKDSNELAARWQSIAAHFDTLFTTENSIDQLKQSILQIAIMGKLVPQDPNEESTNKLLKKIAEEKSRLLEEGKIKKQKELPGVCENEKPFALPEEWRWLRLGETGLGSTGKTPSTNKSEYYGGEIPFLGPGEITVAGKILDTDKTLTEAGCEESTVAEAGDILMVCIGGSIGKSAIAKSRAAFNQQINCIRPLLIDAVFLHYVMNAPYFQNDIFKAATGSATPIINRSKWEELLVPLPPLNEQRRIVAKVGELMALCDALKVRIKDIQTTKVQLADTIIEQSII